MHKSIHEQMVEQTVRSMMQVDFDDYLQKQEVLNELEQTEQTGMDRRDLTLIRERVYHR